MKDENKYMRFDHAAANVEAVPFVDEKVYTVRDKEQLIASALSSRSAEIREVLEGFRPREDRYAGGWCWCDKDLTNDRQPHSKHCETVNALYAKLQPLQIENPPDTLRE